MRTACDLLRRMAHDRTHSHWFFHWRSHPSTPLKLERLSTGRVILLVLVLATVHFRWQSRPSTPLKQGYIISVLATHKMGDKSILQVPEFNTNVVLEISPLCKKPTSRQK